MKKLYLLLLCTALGSLISCNKDNSDTLPTGNNMVFETEQLEIIQNQTANMAAIKNKPADKTVSYFSSNEKVATVDKQGVIFAVGEGTAQITAYVEGDYSDTYTKKSLAVVVKANAILTKMNVDVVDKIAKGDTVEALVTYTPLEASNRDFKIMTTDSVGVQYVDYVIGKSKNYKEPDTIKVCALQYGKVEFFLQVGEDIVSNRVAVEVTGQVNATAMKWTLTPDQVKEEAVVPYPNYYYKEFTIGGEKRQVLDTLAVSFTPDDATQTKLKIANSSNDILAKVVTYKEKIGDKKYATRQGIEISLNSSVIQPASALIYVSNDAGMQIRASVHANLPDSKLAKVKEIKFNKPETELFVNGGATLPYANITYDGINLPQDTIKVRNALVYEWVADYPEKGPKAENIQLQTYYDGSIYAAVYYGQTGFGEAKLAVSLKDPESGKVIVTDTLLVKVNQFNENIQKNLRYKAVYDYVNGKYVVSTIFNPLVSSYNFSSYTLNGAVKAKLMKVGEKEDKVVASVDMVWNDTDLYWRGAAFEPFADDAKLANYYVRFEFEKSSNGKTAKYFYDQKTIGLNDGATFVAPRK